MTAELYGVKEVSTVDAELRVKIERMTKEVLAAGVYFCRVEDGFLDKALNQDRLIGRRPSIMRCRQYILSHPNVPQRFIDLCKSYDAPPPAEQAPAELAEPAPEQADQPPEPAEQAEQADHGGVMPMDVDEERIK